MNEFEEEMNNYLPEIRDFLKQYHIINGVYSSPNMGIGAEIYKYVTKPKPIEHPDVPEVDYQLAFMKYYGPGMCPLEIFDEERL